MISDIILPEMGVRSCYFGSGKAEFYYLYLVAGKEAYRKSSLMSPINKLKLNFYLFIHRASCIDKCRFYTLPCLRNFLGHVGIGGFASNQAAK